MSSQSKPKRKRKDANQVTPPLPSSSISNPDPRSNDSTSSEDSSSDENLSTDPWWCKYLSNGNNSEWIAHVDTFKNAPLASRWKEFAKLDLVVEVPISIPQFSDHLPVYWLGRVVHYAGYYGLVEFEKIEGDKLQRVVWVPMFTNLLKPFGYCYENGILLYPPSRSLMPDPTYHVKKTLECLVANKVESLPPNHEQLFKEEMNSISGRFKLNEIVEALDRNDCSRYRMAEVIVIIGDRMKVAYLDALEEDGGFWFSQNSSDIHKIGWCQAVGAQLIGVNTNLIYPIPELTEFVSVPGGPVVQIQSQMIFEMRHPVFPHKMVCGYVVEVLNHGYFLAGTDWTCKEELVEMVMHISSDYILPLNFCRDHRINLVPPYDKAKEQQPKIFSWRAYLEKENCKQIPLRPKNVNSPFIQGSKLEAFDTMSPAQLQPATVVQVAGHLLRLRFDRLPVLEDTSYQWVSCRSSNIYPVGYSEMIGYPLACQPEPPNPLDRFQLPNKT